MAKWLPALALIGVSGAVALALMVSPPEDDGPPLRTVVLAGVSNASGLSLIRDGDSLLVATVDEVDEWSGPGAPPPLITLSDPMTGAVAGGFGQVGSFGEIEALAVRDGHFVFPYKTGAQTVVLRWKDQDIRLIDERALAALDAVVQGVVPGRWFYEFEGLEWHAGRYELLATAVQDGARESPSTTGAVTRLWFGPDGTLERVSPVFRDAEGAIYRDYAAALCVVGDDLAVVPGFFTPGVTLFDRDGRAVRHIALPTERVEGVDYDPEAGELFLVRECVGSARHFGGAPDCASGVRFGVPLWIARARF